MANKKEETASFVLRFTQKIFENEDGEPQVQWRGNIRHVQGGEEKRFSEFEEVTSFLQSKLSDLTIQAIGDKTPEEQKGILSKSFDLWKQMAIEYPKKMLIETIKDPKKQVAQFQSQINQVSDAIGQKLEIDSWKVPSKSDYNNMMQMMEKMAENIAALNEKVDQLTNSKS